MGELLADLYRMMLARKKFFLLPLAVMLVLIGALTLLAQGSVLAPFIYAIF